MEKLQVKLHSKRVQKTKPKAWLPSCNIDNFYDCHSDHDCESGVPVVNRADEKPEKIGGCEKPRKKCKDACDNSENIRVRSVLQCAANTAEKLLQFYTGQGYSSGSHTATLEITARLLCPEGPRDCTVKQFGSPVTLKVPIKFDPSTGELNLFEGNAFSFPEAFSRTQQKIRFTYEC